MTRWELKPRDLVALVTCRSLKQLGPAVGHSWERPTPLGRRPVDASAGTLGVDASAAS